MGGRVLEHEAKKILNRGIAEGKREGIVATARRMLADGMSPDRVSRLTTLSLEQVEALKA